MPKYYGCPCESCGKPLTLTDDIVVCPDCGAPYHRTCYDKRGACAHVLEHKAGFEWKFPYQPSELRTCPSCGERTLRGESFCRCCGKPLPIETAQTEQPSDRAANGSEKSFDYDSIYRQTQKSHDDPLEQQIHAAFGPGETLDGISCRDWRDYIGRAAPQYMASYALAELKHTKLSVSISALLFGPFYFFYRKAWKPAFAFLAAEFLLMTPSIIDMMQISGSSLSPGLSDSALIIMARICNVLSFLLMLVRGFWGKWLYRKDAGARIRRICAEFPDPEKRRAVLSAQGGTSIAAVFGCFVLIALFSSIISLALGPNIADLLAAMYG